MLETSLVTYHLKGFIKDQVKEALDIDQSKLAQHFKFVHSSGSHHWFTVTEWREVSEFLYHRLRGMKEITLKLLENKNVPGEFVYVWGRRSPKGTPIQKDKVLKKVSKAHLEEAGFAFGTKVVPTKGEYKGDISESNTNRKSRKVSSKHNRHAL